MLEQSGPKELHLMERSHAGAIPESCLSGEGYVLETFVKDCLLWVGLHSAAGEDIKEEGAAETKQSPSPWAPAGEEVENLKEKLNPIRRERWREDILRFSFSFSDLIGRQLN